MPKRKQPADWIVAAMHGDLEGVPPDFRDDWREHNAAVCGDPVGALPVAYRQFRADSGEIDQEARTVSFSFSSETPVDRFWFDEILSHEGDAADLSRLNDGAQFLVNHDVDQVAGVNEKAEIVDSRGMATVRFGTSAFAEEIFQDVVNGIRTNISFAYRIHEIERIVEKEGEKEQVFVRSWEALETSIVSVPADASVGIGRGFDASPAARLERNHLAGLRSPVKIIQPKRKVFVMATKPQKDDDNGAPNNERTPPNADEIRKQEIERIAEVTKLGRHFKCQDEADKAVRAGTSVAEFHAEIIGRQLDKGGDLDLEKPAGHIDMEKKEVERFSFMRLIQSEILGKPDFAGLEREASAAVAKKMNREPKGTFFIPTDVLVAPVRISPAAFLERGGSMQAVLREMVLSRQLDSTTAGGAAELVGTDHLGASFIDLLRSRMMVRRLGAVVLSGLRGNVRIPSQTAGGNAAFVAEGAASPKNNLQTGSVSLSPKNLANRQDYTRQLLLQSDPSIEALVRDDLTIESALAADAAAINGAGGDAPTGILNTVGIGDVAHGINGGPPTWPTTVALETALTAANADQGSLAYVTTPAARGKYKTVEKAATTGQFIWPDVPLDTDGMSMMNGYRAGSSNQVPNNLTKGTGTSLSANIFANWSDCLFGEWGVLDLLVDPYSGSQNGLIAIQAWFLMDFAVRRVASFAAAKDLVTT